MTLVPIKYIQDDFQPGKAVFFLQQAVFFILVTFVLSDIGLSMVAGGPVDNPLVFAVQNSISLLHASPLCSK